MTAHCIGCHFPSMDIEVSFLIILALVEHNPFSYICIFALLDDYFLIADECVTLLLSVCSINSVIFKHG